MPSVQIKHVPPQIHAILKQRAKASGQSMQEYLLARLIAETSAPTVDEMLDLLSQQAPGSISLSQAAALIADDRAGR